MHILFRKIVVVNEKYWTFELVNIYYRIRILINLTMLPFMHSWHWFHSSRNYYKEYKLDVTVCACVAASQFIHILIIMQEKYWKKSFHKNQKWKESWIKCEWSMVVKVIEENINKSSDESVGAFVRIYC